QRISAGVLGVLGIVVFVLGANTALYFATGSKLFVPSSGEDREVQEHCSVSVAASVVDKPSRAPVAAPAHSSASPDDSADENSDGKSASDPENDSDAASDAVLDGSSDEGA
ncbi:MAG: MSCRAMM family adhesin SdrC, partial [Polyangiaceae bacterium]|nr:MSCRAMM family adhesin SdrC [Polyangiaceae bacterium]